MKTRKKISLIFIVLALILTFLLSGTMAFYIAKRSASGTLSFDKGIFLEFGNVDGEGYSRNLLLTDGNILDISIVPNQVVEIKNPYIKALGNSIPFYLKARLTYFSNVNGTLSEVEKSKLAEILNLNAFGNVLDFNSKFLPDDNNEWFYFVSDASKNLDANNLAVVNAGESVNIFETPSFKVANFTCETGSPNEIENLVIKLEISALQASDMSAKDFGLVSSSISEQVLNVENGSVRYLADASTVNILEFNGTDIVINDNDLPVDGKEIIIEDSAFDNVGINESLGEKVVYLYDKEIVECLVLDMKSKSKNLLGEVYIATSQEIYDYIFNDLLTGEENSVIAIEIENYSFILLDSEL